MSVLNKKPFIQTILESLSAEQITTLKGLINGTGSAPVFRTLKVNSGRTTLSTSDKGIKNATIELNNIVAQSLYTGYLVYTDDYCVLISYVNDVTQKLTLLDMSLANGTWLYVIKPCELSILELRSELDDTIEGENELPDYSAANTGDALVINGNKKPVWGLVKANSVNYSTTAPTADNTDGLKVIVLDSEPDTKYNGYLYIITGE